MKSIKGTILIIFLLLTFTSCFDNYDELVPDLEGVPAGGVQSVRIMNVTGNTLQLEISVFAVDHFGGFIDGLSAENFTVASDNSNYNYRILGVTEEDDDFVGAYSAGLLFDQSGSINDTDPTSDRITAGVSFAKLLDGDDEAAVAAFSDGGFYTLPYELLENFSKDKNQLIQSIESLAGKADGGTPLYLAIDQLIPFIDTEANNTNKAIIAFTDGEDTEGGVVIEEMIQRACQAGIKIYTVGLSTSVDELVLSEIAFRTGGAVMLAENALQLVSLYSSLGELLQGEGRYYKIQMEVINPSNNWNPGLLIDGKVNLNLSKDHPIGLPFLANLTYENSGTLNNRIPDCNCNEDFADDLVKKWKDKTDEILKSYPDLLLVPTPNDQMTCAYARIYHDNPEKFKWAGIASIVSGIIGTNDKYLDIVYNANEFQASVLAGNKAIFDDLFWQHLAFSEEGMEEIQRLYCADAIEINVYRAWLKISQDNNDIIWEGNEDLLFHEQKNIVQEIMYDPHPDGWDLLQTAGFIDSPVPGHEDEEMPNILNIEKFSDRWAWIAAKVFPDWKIYESNTQNKADLKSIHESYCKTCCN